MRHSLSLGISTAAAAVVTHAAVFSGLYFDDPFPVSWYQGSFREAALAIERLWSYAHGWQPMSHIRDFGSFYAPMVQLLCPLLGFALFLMISRHRVGQNVWKPVSIAALLAIPFGYISVLPIDAIPWMEAARTILVILLMACSVGAIRFPRVRTPATGSLASA